LYTNTSQFNKNYRRCKNPLPTMPLWSSILSTYMAQPAGSFTLGRSGVVEGERGVPPDNFFGETPFPKWYHFKGEWWYSSVPPSRLAKKCKVYSKL